MSFQAGAGLSDNVDDVVASVTAGNGLRERRRRS